MTEDSIISNSRCKGSGYEECSGSNKAIDQYDHSATGSFEHAAGNLCDFKTAIRSQRLQRCSGYTKVLNGTLQYGYFVIEGLVAEAGTAPYTLLDRYSGQGVHQSAGGRGVANAHFAKAYHIAAACVNVFYYRRPLFQACYRLLLSHGRTVGKIGCALPYFGIYKAFKACGEIVINAGIDYVELYTVLFAEYVDGCTTTNEVHDHLPGNFLRVGADAFGYDAVIACKDEHVRVAQYRCEGLLYQPDAQGQRLKHTQRMERLGFLIDFMLKRSPQPVGYGRYRILAHCYFNAKGIPETIKNARVALAAMY